MKPLSLVTGLILALFMPLCARENPFVPAVSQEQMPVTSSDPQIKKSLQSHDIKLPQGAKILTGVSVHYQDASGEVKTKKYTLDKKIDWHNPLTLTQKKKRAKVKKYTLAEGVSITQKGYTATIYSNDMIIRDFHLSDPFKIVFDFRSKKSFNTQTVSMQQPFDKAVMGSHRGYYRVVLKIDAVYSYDVKKVQEGVRIELK